MKVSKRTQDILQALDEQYGVDVTCHLHYKEPWHLLVATILSAQCTDARVNMVTPELFKKYPTIEALANANVEELEQDIHSIGFFHNKARNLILCCQRLHTEFHDELPSSIEELTSLAGVGRKTANVIRGNIFHEPSIVVDTHVKRISKRLGFTREDDPVKVEYDLMKVIPKDNWIRYNIQVISFGREICKAPTPKCENCFLVNYCKNKGTKA